MDEEWYGQIVDGSSLCSALGLIICTSLSLPMPCFLAFFTLVSSNITRLFLFLAHRSDTDYIDDDQVSRPSSSYPNTDSLVDINLHGSTSSLFGVGERLYVKAEGSARPIALGVF